jgi:hypothetical protein
VTLSFNRLLPASVLSLRHSPVVWGIQGCRRERPVKVGIGLCGGVVQLPVTQEAAGLSPVAPAKISVKGADITR